jgi:hypothetical protein
LMRKHEIISMLQVIDDPSKVENAYAYQYENLARRVANLVHTRSGVSQ